MRILGFDVSSSTVGWGVLDKKDGKLTLVDSGYIKPSKDDSIFHRLSLTCEDIKKIIEKYNPDEIGIEDIAQFMPKVSSAKTIITLAVFNRAIGLTCFKTINKEPHLINVTKIRHGIKIGKLAPKKEEIPELIEKQLGISFPWTTKVDRKTKLQKRVDENYDRADGIAVALYLGLHLK